MVISIGFGLALHGFAFAFAGKRRGLRCGWIGSGFEHTVRISALSRRFRCVPANKHSSVRMNAINAVISGKMRFKSGRAILYIGLNCCKHG